MTKQLPPEPPEDQIFGPTQAPGAKQSDLDMFRQRAPRSELTTDQGVPIAQTDDSLRAGLRGPTLLEDFHLREKITRFDHERIPERVVHARGTGAHGYFRVYKSLADLTAADFLCDPEARTPVFVRFSTVVGSRGSSDLARDVRGFATKFYTRQGNFDLVGNNMPVFFIQDGIKFPDLIHAVKPEPRDEIPQAASAHDTFWDFVSLVPETMHMVMWVMSDRALPRSLRMMEGFGVHTFRLVNSAGRSVLCKFHWRPLLGAHSLLWDEAQKISGKDPDFHRRDLRDAIDQGDYPEFELGLQTVAEEDALAYGFDMLDPTKLLPEELVPVQRVGKMTLDRNPQNYFAEVEQVAFCVANVVPGIDFTDDPLMQARLFSYLDTQITRLGGPNFAELPINRPLAPMHNHQQDGFGRTTIPTLRALYHPNTVAGNRPQLAPAGRGFRHFAERIDAAKVRERSESFGDHYGQARMFLHSQSPAERAHLVAACRFELGHVERLAIRERVIGHFHRIDEAFAAEVAAHVGVSLPVALPPVPAASPADKRGRAPATSPALSLANQPASVRTRKVALLALPGVSAGDVRSLCGALVGRGARVEVVSTALGPITTDQGGKLDVDKTFLTTDSVLYDAVVVPGGASARQLAANAEAIQFVRESFRHAKPIAAVNDGIDVLTAAHLPGIPLASDDEPIVSAQGVVTARADQLQPFAEQFLAALAAHRHFTRQLDELPA